MRERLRWIASRWRSATGVAAWWWVPVFYALVVMWTYRGLWHQHGVATGLGWDVIDTHGPDLEGMARELREGRFSLWNPWDKGGYAMYADPIVCRYYPFAWPFVAWGAAFGVSWWLIQIEVLAHHVAMAVCLHGFLRSRGLSVRAAMIGGVGLVVSAPLLVHKASNILWPMAWVPLVWMAIDAAVARPSWRRGAAVAAAFALCATAGSPPGLFYASLLVAPYGVWRVATVRPPWRRLVGCAAVAAVLAALVVAVTVIPAQTLVALSWRDRWAQGDAFALSLSFDWRGVVRGAFAFGAGFPEMYVGAAVVMLAGCALVQPRRDGGAPQLFGLIAVVGFVLVAGSYLWLLPWLVHHVPGFALMRIPGRYKLLAVWSLAAAAGYGADGLDDARPRASMLAVVVALGASIATVIGHGVTGARPAWWSIAAMAVPCALAVVALYVPRLRGAAVSGLVIAVLLDAPAFVHAPAAPPAAEPRQRHARDDEVLARLDGVRDHWRLYDEFILGERVGQRRGVRDLRGYPAIDPLLHRRYFDVLEYARRDPAIVTDVNVRWLLHAPHFRFGAGGDLVASPGDAFADRGGGLFEARHPAPLVAWYGAVTLVTDAGKVLPAMRVVQDTDGVRRRAVIEPDAIAATVEAPRAGLVVLDELAYPGWTVEVDGAPATSVRANYVMRAVAVGAGRHAIRWRFEPPWIRALIAGYVLALAVMLAAAVLPRGRRRAPAPASRAG
ncbi:MAG: YfhO family protein [Deltaproteobacteria bacterium]|nr:MAG: YfhO family protein [Deltaproteobacteria bacterium]